MLDSALLGMLQLAAAVHPGPLKTTMALPGSNPVPVIVKPNVCPARTGLGEVVTAVMRAPATVSGTILLEGVPLDPFCTVTVKLPSVIRVVEPLICVELLLTRALLGTGHFAGARHPGPLKTTIALVGSNPTPTIVKSNAWPRLGGYGEVSILATVGVPKATTIGTAFEGAPEPFCTVTLKCPPGSLAEPIT